MSTRAKFRCVKQVEDGMKIRSRKEMEVPHVRTYPYKEGRDKQKKRGRINDNE